MIDIQQKKTKILEFLKTQGPSLPVHVAKAIQMDPVFASAILSELLNTKAIKTSHMKIGASPLYLLPGQEEKLEEKTEHLKSIEKETQEKLKLKGVIYDENEEPATRVALRNIKDFAAPFKFQNKIVWKYAFTPQEKIDKILLPKKETLPAKRTTREADYQRSGLPVEDDPVAKSDSVPKAWEVTPNTKEYSEQQKKKEIHETKKDSKKPENIFEKKEETPIRQQPTKANPHSEPPATNPAEKQSFLKEIEQFLKTQETSITTIDEVDKRKVTAIVESKGKTSLLFAFNKSRINETELLKSYKIADKKNLPYQIITRGNLTKKLTDTILAHQKLIKISKLQ